MKGEIKLSKNTFELQPASIEDLSTLFGDYDSHLTQIQTAFDTSISARGTTVFVSGGDEVVQQVQRVLQSALELIEAQKQLTPTDINYIISLVKENKENRLEALTRSKVGRAASGKLIFPKTWGQKKFVDAMRTHDMTFAIGPAGTGKTYLAVVFAVNALKNQEVARIILTRPAVEAGENLGFLPGDLKEKVDPYLRPLYDALYDMLTVETTEKMMEKGLIEIAPLAYMRGRTLDDAFVILDEAQNTLPSQMKMFLTRMGSRSKVVVTGDITQIDLRKDQPSGLIQASEYLREIKEIAFVTLSGEDVVRHPLVQKILEVYEKKR